MKLNLSIAERNYRATRIVRTRIKEGTLMVSELTISGSHWKPKLTHSREFIMVPATILVPIEEVENFIQEDHF